MKKVFWALSLLAINLSHARYLKNESFAMRVEGASSAVILVVEPDDKDWRERVVEVEARQKKRCSQNSVKERNRGSCGLSP